MSRVIDDLVKAVLDNNSNIPYTILVRAELRDSAISIPPWNDNILRFTMSGHSIYWDELGTGDVEYIGAGNFLQISQVEEGTELQAYGLNITLSGIPIVPELVPEIKNARYKNGRLSVYLAVLDSNYNIVHDGVAQTGPILLFSGRMDTMQINLGKEASINVTAVSRMADWERPRGGRFNSANQNRYYDFSLPKHADKPLWTQGTRDKGFDYVESIRYKEIYWGGKGPGGSVSSGDVTDTNRGIIVEDPR